MKRYTGLVLAFLLIPFFQARADRVKIKVRPFKYSIKTQGLEIRGKKGEYQVRCKWELLPGEAIKEPTVSLVIPLKITNADGHYRIELNKQVKLRKWVPFVPSSGCQAVVTLQVIDQTLKAGDKKIARLTVSLGRKDQHGEQAILDKFHGGSLSMKAYKTAMGHQAVYPAFRTKD